MTPRAYYNENDTHAAQWLRNLIACGVIAPGDVDERDIRDVTPAELRRYTQCHFFAGIGVWSYALRRAGWPDHRPVWSGSCPCQPFSSAGKGEGFDDERHLWPDWYWLVDQCRPDVIFGEQVASKDGLSWFDLVQSDLEISNYAVGVLDSCVAGVGAPHIRQRLFFVADSGRERCESERLRLQQWQPRIDYAQTSRRCETGKLADSESVGLLGRSDERDDGRRQCTLGQRRETGELEHAACYGREQRRPEPSERSLIGGRGASELADAASPRLEIIGQYQGSERAPAERSGEACGSGPTNGFWRAADWLYCTDGKWRPVEPGAFPLVDGATFRMGLDGPYAGKSRQKILKGYGNAINAVMAAEFIKTAMECIVAKSGYECYESMRIKNRRRIDGEN